MCTCTLECKLANKKNRARFSTFFLLKIYEQKGREKNLMNDWNVQCWQESYVKKVSLVWERARDEEFIDRFLYSFMPLFSFKISMLNNLVRDCWQSALLLDLNSNDSYR